MKTITVTVSPKGEVAIEGSGFKGPACDKAMTEIESALGITKARKNKGEYYQKDVTRCATH